MTHLQEIQRIPTSGARGVEAFTVDGAVCLAVPQLAYDAPGTPAGMNGGDSNTDILLFKQDGEEFTAAGRLPGTGGEDVEYFEIDGVAYVACACIRMGSGPYNFNVGQPIYRWSGEAWEPFQTILGFAAKQWRHFTIDGAHYLALAQNRPGDQDVPSAVFRWNGTEFEHLQDIPSRGGYNFHAFEIDGVTYLAHADHALPSQLFRWDGEKFVEHQDLMPLGGRAFATFSRDGEHYMAIANIRFDSVLLRWDGERFVEHAVLPGGKGGRELHLIDTDSGLFLMRANFITGGLQDPHPLLKSPLYKFTGDTFEIVDEFDTSGGTDVAEFTAPDGSRRLAVSNALNGDLGFATESVIYRFAPEGDL